MAKWNCYSRDDGPRKYVAERLNQPSPVPALSNRNRRRQEKAELAITQNEQSVIVAIDQLQTQVDNIIVDIDNLPAPDAGSLELVTVAIPAGVGATDMSYLAINNANGKMVFFTAVSDAGGTYTIQGSFMVGIGATSTYSTMVFSNIGDCALCVNTYMGGANPSLTYKWMVINYNGVNFI